MTELRRDRVHWRPQEIDTKISLGIRGVWDRGGAKFRARVARELCDRGPSRPYQSGPSSRFRPSPTPEKMGLFDKIFRRGRDKRAGDDLTEEDFKRGAARLKEEYKVVRELGAGAEGDVREVVHLASGKHYAMKSIRRRGDRRPRELEVLKRLRHPNLVELEDWFATRTHYFLVFELATGGELLERLVDRGRYTECDAAVLTATIFNAMAFVHAHDIVHRDLKTANLMFKNDDPDAELIIVDFGLARSTIEDSATPNKDMDRKEDQKLLKTWVGTQYYQAPEIVKNKGYYGKPADIYCLGEITYMLLSGLSPFWKVLSWPLGSFDRHSLTLFGVDRSRRTIWTRPPRRTIGSSIRASLPGSPRSARISSASAWKPIPMTV